MRLCVTYFYAEYYTLGFIPQCIPSSDRPETDSLIPTILNAGVSIPRTLSEKFNFWDAVSRIVKVGIYHFVDVNKMVLANTITLVAIRCFQSSVTQNPLHKKKELISQLLKLVGPPGLEPGTT